MQFNYTNAICRAKRKTLKHEPLITCQSLTYNLGAFQMALTHVHLLIYLIKHNNPRTFSISLIHVLLQKQLSNMSQMKSREPVPH